MPTRRPLYLEDYRPGTVFDCGSVTVLDREVIAFAEEFGPRPFQPGSSPDGGLVASHWHTASLVMRMTAITVVAARAARAAVLPGPVPRLDALGDRRP